MDMNDLNPLTIAVFFDLENVAIGVRDVKSKRFEVDRVLGRLLEKGNVIVKRAYANWGGNLSRFKRDFHEHAVELIDLPGSKVSGKNSADIKMVVDALEISYTKPHVNAFALVSGDSDFSPLVSKLRENGKWIIGIGVKQSTSPLLIDNCDEFIFYEDLALTASPSKRGAPRLSKLPKKKAEAFEQLNAAARALLREGKRLYPSLVKETMKRLQPQFNEEYHGYSSFNKLLEDAQEHELIRISRDPKSGTYMIEELLEG